MTLNMMKVNDKFRMSSNGVVFTVIEKSDNHIVLESDESWKLRTIKSTSKQWNERVFRINNTI